MAEPTDDKPASEDPEHAQARDAALEAWHQGQLPSKDEGVESWRPPRRRTALPPSFLIILSFGLIFLALDTTADLRYELFGPSTAIDLGKPGAYNLDQARDGARAKIFGYASSVRGTFAHGGNHEVAALVGIPVLVEQPPEPPAPKDTVEAYSGEGRLVKLTDTPATFIERLLNPLGDSSSRYATVRQQFTALGEIPLGRQSWLLLVGDIPRTDVWAIAEPILLWVLAIGFGILAWRAYSSRAAPPPPRRRVASRTA